MDEGLPDLHEDEAEKVIILEHDPDARQEVAQQEHDDGNHDDDGALKDDNAMSDALSIEQKQSEAPLLVPPKDDAALVLRGHTSDALVVAASPSNPSYIVTGGMDDFGLIWDLDMQMSVATVDGSRDSVSTVAFSHDGQYAAFGSENGSISIVFFDSAQSPPAPLQGPATPLQGPGDTVHFLAWHPRGPILLAGSADHVVYMWNASKAKFLMAFAGHEDAVTCGNFTSDGKHVVTASHDKSLRVWNPSTGQTLLRIQTGLDGLRSAFHNSDILCLAVGPADTMGEKLVVTGCVAGDVFITHRETGQVVSQLPRHEGSVECVAFSPASLQLVLVASAGVDGVVRIWDIENSTERCRFEHRSVVAKVVWHDHKPIIAAGTADGSVSLWNVLCGQRVAQLTGHESFVTDLCFTADHSFVVSTSADDTVRVFDIRQLLATTGAS